MPAKRDYVVAQEGAGQTLPNGWREVTLGECAELIRDSVSPAAMGDALYIGLEHIGENTLSLLGRGIASEVTSAKARFRRGDILFGKLRPYFRKVVRAPADGLCSTDIWVVRAKDGVHQDYLYYCMASQPFVDFATSGSEGTRMPRAKWEYVAKYKLSLPPLPQQRAIAHVLGTLDDKIELNRRMNETLESMARALFKSWFVDFEPVRARMEGRDTGLPAEVSALFPERLADSELGPIPEGWAVRRLGECFNVTMGQSPPGSTYNQDGEGLPFFQGRADFGRRYPTNRVYCSAPSRTADPDDTLVSVRAPVGDMNMAWERCSIGRGLASLRHKSGSSAFTYYTAQAMQNEFQQYEHTGTVFGAITGVQLKGMPHLEPPAKVLAAFQTHVLPLETRMRTITAQSRALAAQRDALLPRLVGGELGVRDQKAID